MWKDFFYYSKGERRAVYVLLVLIALLVTGIVVLSRYRTDKEVVFLPTDSLVVGKSESVASMKEVGKSVSDASVVSVRLEPFDPNMVDSTELLQLGLSRFVARNVVKYRRAGGKFSTPESFARIYGLTDEKFKELKPYIRISEAFVQSPEKLNSMPISQRVERNDAVKRQFKYPPGTLVDVNVADTSELKKIPGIGSGIARMIVSYRSRLGGFYALEQLSEVKYVTPELLDWFKLENDSVRKLNVNQASLDKLRAHPYINFYQAKVIVEYRRKRGRIKSLSQLSLFEEFTEKDLMRLSAYVSFD